LLYSSELSDISDQAGVDWRLLRSHWNSLENETRRRTNERKTKSDVNGSRYRKGFHSPSRLHPLEVRRVIAKDMKLRRIYLTSIFDCLNDSWMAELANNPTELSQLWDESSDWTYDNLFTGDEACWCAGSNWQFGAKQAAAPRSTRMPWRMARSKVICWINLKVDPRLPLVEFSRKEMSTREKAVWGIMLKLTVHQPKRQPAMKAE
jgi:hypothetical protein